MQNLLSVKRRHCVKCKDGRTHAPGSSHKHWGTPALEEDYWECTGNGC